jgi:hypothetical protein
MMANTRIDGLEAEIRRQAFTGLSNRQIADLYGCSYRTVTNRKQEIAKSAAGDHLQSTGGLRDTAAVNSDPLPSNREDRSQLRSLLDAYPDTETLSTDEMMRALTIISATGPPNVKVQALKLLNDIKSQHRPEENKGPGPPSTWEEMVDRLTVLVECGGLEATREAIGRVWPDLHLAPEDRLWERITEERTHAEEIGDEYVNRPPLDPPPHLAASPAGT